MDKNEKKVKRYSFKIKNFEISSNEVESCIPSAQQLTEEDMIAQIDKQQIELLDSTAVIERETLVVPHGQKHFEVKLSAHNV